LKKDIISKEIVKNIIKDIAKKILKLNINNLTLLNTEFERIENRRADILALVDNSYILHIELQSNYDKLMPLRMLRYFTDIKFKYSYPIKQFVIYLGNGILPNGLKEENIDFRYNVIDMKKIDCEIFLNDDIPESLILSILCDFQDKKPNDVISTIIKKLLKITKTKEKFDNYILMLEELSSLRNLKEQVKEYEMILTSKVKWEDLPSYEIGFEKGLEDGLQQGLEKGLQQGLEKGLQEGVEKGKLESAKIMINKFGISVEEVSKELNIPIEVLKKLK
jgi:predicted transposase/invertase (TIGR01784 family)